MDDSFDPYSESILDELTDSKNNCTVRENVDLNHSLEEHRQQIKESNGDGEMLVEKHTESIDSTNQQKPNHVVRMHFTITTNVVKHTQSLFTLNNGSLLYIIGFGDFVSDNKRIGSSAKATRSAYH